VRDEPERSERGARRRLGSHLDFGDAVVHGLGSTDRMAIRALLVEPRTGRESAGVMEMMAPYSQLRFGVAGEVTATPNQPDP